MGLTRAAAALAALFIGLFAIGCGDDEGDSASPGDAGSPAAETAPAADLASMIGKPDKALCPKDGSKLTFGYNTFSDTEEFAVALWDGLQRVANDLGCVELVKYVDNADTNQAVQNARIMAQRKVDGALLFNVIEAAGPGMTQVLKQAKIPVASIVVPPGEGETFLSNDDRADGESAGKALAEAYKQRADAGDAYAIVGRFDGQGATGKARMDGVVAGLQSVLPELKGDRLLEFETKADPPTAQQGTAAVLRRIPKDATILATGINDGIANAVFQAIKQGGRADDAMVISLGAVRPGGLNFICRNEQYVGAQAFQPEKWPDYMIPALLARIGGAEVPDKITIPTQLLLRDQVEEFYPDFECGEKG